VSGFFLGPWRLGGEPDARAKRTTGSAERRRAQMLASSTPQRRRRSRSWSRNQNKALTKVAHSIMPKDVTIEQWLMTIGRSSTTYTVKRIG
jgi:hypothetical protein